MGYYPIKCVHCMRSVAMDERCVKMVPEEVKTFNSRLDGSQPIVVLNNNKKNKQYRLQEFLFRLRRNNPDKDRDRPTRSLHQDFSKSLPYRKHLKFWDIPSECLVLCASEMRLSLEVLHF